MVKIYKVHERQFKISNGFLTNPKPLRYMPIVSRSRCTCTSSAMYSGDLHLTQTLRPIHIVHDVARRRTQKIAANSTWPLSYDVTRRSELTLDSIAQMRRAVIRAWRLCAAIGCIPTSRLDSNDYFELKHFHSSFAGAFPFKILPCQMAISLLQQ
jgi:hypothetical protein